MKLKKFRNLSCFTVLFGLIYFYNNKTIKVSHQKIFSEKLPKDFSGFKIVQVSDIHCQKIGHSDLLFFKRLKKENPDIIVITGDLLDSYRNNNAIAYNILAKLSEIGKCYYVSGNHELRLLDDYEKLKVVFKKLDVENLDNKKINIKKNDKSIILAGIEDFNYFIMNDQINYYANYRNMLKSNFEKDNYNILLAHRPEKFSLYEEIGYDLVFSGHAHGGQWNIPFLGRIFSPSQGFFPKYTNGIYLKNKTKMIVSQGLGNSSFPIRFNNRFELVVATLLKK